MAIFLSRIKKALNLGTKSITENGTYNASTDGYDGYSSVEVNVAGGTATPITPSNSSPAQMTANSPVIPTANGYAIESYSNLTPSDSSSATITSGNMYKAMANGKAVENVYGVSPSTNSQYMYSMTEGKIYKTNGRDGYAIAQSAYSSVTPSDSNPPLLTNRLFYSPLSDGYLYKSSGLGVKPLPVVMHTSYFESASNYPSAYVTLDNLGWTKLTLTAKGIGGSVKTWRYRLDNGTWVDIGSTIGTEFTLGSNWTTLEIQLAGVGSMSRTVTLS